MKTHTLLFLLITFSSSILAQDITIQINGKVTDNNGQPLPFANIYIEQSSLGTTTNEQGEFQFSTTLSGKYRLRCSFIGYVSKSKVIDIQPGQSYDFNFSLKSENIELEEIIVSDERDKSWGKHLKKFKSYFIGTSKFAKECKILNPYVLDFQQLEPFVIRAKASKPLQIENKSLGYILSYELSSFELNSATRDVKYKGFVRFKELEPSSFEEEKLWEKNRKLAYFGSVQHFLKSLSSEDLKSEGFYAAIERIENEKLDLIRSPELKPVTAGDIISKSDQGHYSLNYNAFLRVEYLKRQESMYHDNRPYVYNETSWIKLNKRNVLVNKSGSLANPHDLELFNTFGRKRIAEALPINYGPGDAFDEEANSLSIKRAKMKRLFHNLNRYDSIYPREKVFLKIDENSKIRPGEKIEFKAYLTAGPYHSPSELSRILYVELIDPNNNLVNHGKYEIKDGKTRGFIYPPDTLYNGIYEIRAFTSWMKNFGASTYYRQLVELGDRKELKALNIKFKPKHGKLIANKTNTVYVHTTRCNLPTEARVRLLDEKNKVIQDIRTNAFGIGSFEGFKPKKGKSYYALIDESATKWSLPDAIETNVTLTTQENVDKIRIQISNVSNDNSEMYLLAQSNGIINYFKDVEVSGKLSLEISKYALPYGIGQLSLLDSGFNHIYDYIYFNQNNTPEDSLFSIFSGESLNDYLHIRSYLENANLNPLAELKQNPNSFKELTLASDWNKLDFGEIYQSKFIEEQYPIETGFTVKGKVVIDSSENAQGILHLLIGSNTPQFLTTDTDSLGNFTFEEVTYNDTTDLIFNYINPNYDGVAYFEFEDQDYSFTPSDREVCFSDNEGSDEKSFKEIMTKSQVLKPVQVEAKRIEINSKPRINALYTTPDWSFNFQDSDKIEETIVEATVVGGFIWYLMSRVPNITFERDTISSQLQQVRIGGKNSINSESTALFIYEGISMSPQDFNDIPAELVGKIDILTGGAAAALYGARASNGVFIAYAPEYEYGRRKKGTQRFNLKGGFSIKRLQDEIGGL
ncbi:MAG: carboxypeptidase-like regulatory domain-containing protein [Bacteroidota bacterium]